MKIYLASASPRRQEIMAQVGIEYTVKVSGADEDIDVTEPSLMVEELSFIKAQAVATALEDENSDEYCVIGADTVVALDGSVLGKPVDESDARAMLTMLSGRNHQVYTGVTVLVKRQSEALKRVTFHETTTVNMCEMSLREIDRYIATGEPMDKAGAYGIQSGAAIYVRGIEGDYYNVVGLPIAGLYQELCKLNVINT